MPVRLTTFSTLAVLALPLPAIAGGDEAHCQRKIGIEGPPHIFSTIANMNAVRMWAKAVETKYGPEYTMWHNADGRTIKCAHIKKSKAIKCFARGAPCKAHVSSKTAKAAPN